MKGLVFTQFLAMAEESVGEKRVDDMIDRCPLHSGGAYNAVGNYDCSELTTLVGELSRETGIDVGELQKAFGRWMLQNFVATHPEFFEAKACAFDMLESVENEVHTEVRKLYPDAELPRFETRRPDPQTLEFIYRSPRRLATFCEGLIEACLMHYGEAADIRSEDVSDQENQIVRFLISKTDGGA